MWPTRSTLWTAIRPPSPPLRLAPGDHTVEAFLPGYKPATRTFTLSPGVAKPYVVSFKLEPEPVRLRLSSGLKSGQVSLDGQPPVDLQDGNFVNDAIALSSEHTFSLTQAGKPSLVFSFRAEPGGMVTLNTPIKVKDVSVVVISTLGSSARVYASDNSLKGGLKDSTPQPIPVEGLEFGGITASSEITLDDGKSQRTVPMEVGNAPTLTISLANDPNLGTLQVEVSVPGAELSLDGRPARPLHAGSNYRGLEPGTHTIRLLKEGYETVVRSVELKKGEMVHLGVIDLKPVVRTASLVIEGATREAEVLIDGAGRGVVGGDGSFRLDDLSPEGHAITLRKADFEDKQLSRTFTVGQPVRLSGADVQLTAVRHPRVPGDPAEREHHLQTGGRSAGTSRGERQVCARESGALCGHSHRRRQPGTPGNRNSRGREAARRLTGPCRRRPPTILRRHHPRSLRNRH